MSNNYLSVLYKHLIQVENKNGGLQMGGGGAKNTIYIYITTHSAHFNNQRRKNVYE